MVGFITACKKPAVGTHDGLPANIADFRVKGEETFLVV